MSQSRAPARLFAALGDETRLRLVARLCDGGPASITRLTARSKITRQAITKHLRLMEDSGLVRSTRQGRETIWQLEPPGIEDARRYLDGVSAQWDDALLRLRRFVEK
jgi:DNA-binding transcriptional ArsR family regulator